MAVAPCGHEPYQRSGGQHVACESLIVVCGDKNFLSIGKTENYENEVAFC